MKIIDVPHGSAEWLMLRAGLPTASEFHKILTPTGKPSKQAEAYMYRLIAERLMGRPLESEATQWMQRGLDLEDEAIKAYEFHADQETQAVGFVTTDDGKIGCSPDRLVGDDGLLELKVPAPHTHVGYLLTRKLEDDYHPQLQGQLWVTGRTWVDVCSYHPELPPMMLRVIRDCEYIGLLEAAVTTFFKCLESSMAVLEGRGILPKPNPAPVDHSKDFISDEDLALILERRKESNG